MGIKVEFNPDLALRAYGTPDRKEAECLPSKLEVGKIYEFLKEGQRNYWLEGEIPLCETRGEGRLSRPIASVVILDATQFIAEQDGKLYTGGRYAVKAVFDATDKTIHFEGMNRVKGKDAKSR